MKTILGRYLPRTELLHAWTILKQNIVQDPSLNETDKNLEFINNITNKIKQIYNDTCLKDESTEHKEKTVKVNKLNKRTVIWLCLTLWLEQIVVLSRRRRVKNVRKLQMNINYVLKMLCLRIKPLKRKITQICGYSVVHQQKKPKYF